MLKKDYSNQTQFTNQKTQSQKANLALLAITVSGWLYLIYLIVNK